MHLIPLSACTPCHPCPLGPDRAGGCSACARGRGAARGRRQPEKTARHGRAHFRDAQPTKPVGALLCFEIRLALSEFAALAVIVSRGRCLLGLVACLFVAARCFACRCSVSTSTSSFTPPRPTSAATTQPHTESCASPSLAHSVSPWSPLHCLHIRIRARTDRHSTTQNSCVSAHTYKRRRSVPFVPEAKTRVGLLFGDVDEAEPPSMTRK